MLNEYPTDKLCFQFLFNAKKGAAMNFKKLIILVSTGLLLLPACDGGYDEHDTISEGTYSLDRRGTESESNPTREADECTGRGCPEEENRNCTDRRCPRDRNTLKKGYFYIPETNTKIM